MIVQQRIILSHKTHKLAHESQKRQNDYPDSVQIMTVGVFKYNHFHSLSTGLDTPINSSLVCLHSVML